MRSRGRMLVLISTVWAQRTKQALTRALIGGAQPVEGWWAPVAQHTYKRKRWGSVANNPKMVALCPTNRNPSRSGMYCSDGKRHRPAATASRLRRPLRHSTGDAAIILDCRCRHRHHIVSALRVAALAQNFTDEPVVALDKGKSPFDLHSSRSI